MNSIKYTLSFALSSILCFSSCLKDIEKASKVSHAQWNGNYALQLAKSDLTAANILASRAAVDNLISVPAPNGLYTFLYYKTFFSKQAKDYVSLPDFNASTSVAGQGSTTPTNQTKDFVASIAPGGGRELTRIALKSGNLRITINSTFKQSFFIKLRFPNSSASVGGVVETPEYLVGVSSSGTMSLVQNFDLSGATFPTNAPPTGFNSLACQAIIRINGASTPITSLDNISIGLLFSALGYGQLDGYLGNINFAQNDEDTVRIKLFDDDIEDGSIIFNDPSAEVEPSNSFGIPIRLTMDNLRSIPKNKPTVLMTGTGANAFTGINVLPATPGEPFKISPTIIINKTTSNIVAMMEPAPENFSYRLTLATNPGVASATNRSQFLKDTSRIRMRALVRLPADGRVLRYRFRDTLAVNFPDSGEGQQYIESVLAKLVVVNGFPIDADLQGIFVDKDNKAVDSVAISPAGSTPAEQRESRLIAKTAPVNAAGRVDQTQAVRTEKIYVIAKARYNNLRLKAKKIIFRANLNTNNASGGTNVLIYPDYRFKIELGIQVKTDGKIKIN